MSWTPKPSSTFTSFFTIKMRTPAFVYPSADISDFNQLKSLVMEIVYNTIVVFLRLKNQIILKL